MLEDRAPVEGSINTVQVVGEAPSEAVADSKFLAKLA